jgi:hypothetical protein
MQIGVEGSVRYRVRSIRDFGSPRNADIFSFRSMVVREKSMLIFENFGST